MTGKLRGASSGRLYASAYRRPRDHLGGARITLGVISYRWRRAAGLRSSRDCASVAKNSACQQRISVRVADGTTAGIAPADLYELFSKVSALQQPKESFWHVFDPFKHIFFETDVPRSVPMGETL